MLTKEENEALTRVSPGTPAGEMLRRYWHPIAFIDELKMRPLRRRILGEDLVLFRDEQNRLGLLSLRCSHRGTSLEFGHLEDGGLRCCYHGWLYDVDGRILEQPGEPLDSSCRQRVQHPAYKVQEVRRSHFCLPRTRAVVASAPIRCAGDEGRPSRTPGKDRELQFFPDD